MDQVLSPGTVVASTHARSEDVAVALDSVRRGDLRKIKNCGEVAPFDQENQTFTGAGESRVEQFSRVDPSIAGKNDYYGVKVGTLRLMDRECVGKVENPVSGLSPEVSSSEPELDTGPPGEHD